MSCYARPGRQSEGARSQWTKAGSENRITSGNSDSWYALTLAGVDPGKIALMGVSLGGYLAPRAAAFEKRISALIANDGVYDYGVANLGGRLPPEQRAATAAWALTHGMFVTGTASPRAYVAATLSYHLRDGVAEKISCPTLVLDAEEDMFFKGQPEELYEHLTCPKTLMRFTVAHCQVGAIASLSAAFTTGWIKRWGWRRRSLGRPSAQLSKIG